MLPEFESHGRVIVCEDDEHTRRLLCEGLEADCYEALGAPTAEDALRLLRYEDPDLLLLDLNLPDAGGLDVLREIRRDRSPASAYDPDLPVIVLSGRGSGDERVRGLREGADDYLVKPFHYPELLERVRIATRERRTYERGPVRVGQLRLDPASREVSVGERHVDLSAKEFELLRYLAVEPQRVFTKAELLSDVWGYESSARTRTLDSHASRLRRKLDPEGGRYIVNAWGVGYRLVEGAV